MFDYQWEYSRAHDLTHSLLGVGDVWSANAMAIDLTLCLCRTNI